MANEYLTKKYLHEHEEHEKTKKELHKSKLDYTVLEESYNSLTLAYDELNAKLNKIEREGALGYILNEQGYIIETSVLNPYSERTFIQELPSELQSALGTKLYNRFPFGKVEKGIVVIDTEQYKKYKLGGLI